MNVPVKHKAPAPSLLMDPDAFNHMQRVGSMLALSPLFPDHLRKGSKETAIANGVLVMNMAARLNEDPLTVAQNIYFVSGKPGWSSSYMIGKANQHGVFKNPISWDVTGKGQELSVVAFAELAATGKRVEVTCDMAMAKAEGWVKNSKYQSMPEQMLRYRSATFLIRLYCPEVMVGVPSQVEVELGMKDVTPVDYAAARARADADKVTKTDGPEDAVLVEETDHDPETGEVTEDAPTQDETGSEKSEPEPKAPKEEDPDRFNGVIETIKRDLLDSPNVDDVLDFYADQIGKIQSGAPKAYSELMEYIEECRKNEADAA